MIVEYACELVEQIISLCGEVALIKVVADDEFLKGDFGEVGSKWTVTPYARDTDRLRRYGVEPVKSRDYLGDLEGGKDKRAFAEFTDKIGVVSVSN